MAEILTRSDLITTPAAGAKSELATGMKEVTDNLGGIKDILNLVDGILGKVSSIQQNRILNMQPQQAAGVQVESLPKSRQIENLMNQAPPQSQVSAPPCGTPIGEKAAVPFMPPPTISRQKLVAFLTTLIEKDCQKLPKEIKERKVGDIVGSNWQKFEYKHLGVIPVDGKMVIEQMADTFIKILPELYE